MSIVIINKEDPKFKNIFFKEFSETESISIWVKFEFKIMEAIDDTGLLFYLESNVSDMLFKGESDHSVVKFKFGSRDKLRPGQILERRVRFLILKPLKDIDSSMLFTIKLYSDFQEPIREDKIICTLKK